MASTAQERANKQKLVQSYHAKIKKHEQALYAKLTVEQKGFFEMTYKSSMNIFNALTKALREGVRPSDYLQNEMRWVFGTLVPEDKKEMVLYFADNIRDYQYSMAYYRRSFRSSSYAPYAERLRSLLRSTFYSSMAGDVVASLTHTLPEDAQAYFDEFPYTPSHNPYEIAYALDMHNTEAEEAVRRILTEENSGTLMTSNLIRGIFCSHNAEFHELLGKLLLAARLQEGLRQAICENADYGTAEGFLAILRVIEANDLIRFSSVKRAVGTWLGIINDDTRDLERISAKSIALIVECLSDEHKRNEHLSSKDNMALYIALWSVAFYDIESVIPHIERIAESGEHHQLLTAGYFARNLSEHHTQHRIAKTVIAKHRGEQDILAVWLSSFMAGYHNPEEYASWFTDKNEVITFYAILKDIYDGIHEKKKVFSPCIFPWNEEVLNRSAMTRTLSALARMTGDDDYIDDACRFIKECDGDDRWYCFDMLVSNPTTQTQRKTIFEAVADKESSTRGKAIGAACKLSPTKEEYAILESHLRLTNAETRTAVIAILLKQTDIEIEKTLQRLLSAEKENIRLAAYDMLTALKKNATKRPIAEAFTPRLLEISQTKKLSSKEEIILDTLLPKEEEEQAPKKTLFSNHDIYYPSNFDEDFVARSAEVFLRYFPDSKLPEQILGKKPTIAEKLKNIFTANRSETYKEAKSDILSLSELITAHEKDEITRPWDGEKSILSVSIHHLSGVDGEKFPLREIWESWYSERGMTPERLIRARVLSLAYGKHNLADLANSAIHTVYGEGFSEFYPVPYAKYTCEIFRYLTKYVPEEELTLLGAALAIWFIRCEPKKDFSLYVSYSEHYTANEKTTVHLLSHGQINVLYSYLKCRDDDMLPALFPIAVVSDNLKKPYAQYAYRLNNTRLAPEAYLLAAYRGLITERQLFYHLFNLDARHALITITNCTIAYRDKNRLVSVRDTYHSWKSSYRARHLTEMLESFRMNEEQQEQFLAYISHLYDIVVPFLVEPELKRGTAPEPYSYAVLGIERLYGADMLVAILQSLGNDNLGPSFYGTHVDRRDILSHMLAVCIPKADETVESLRKALDGKSIKKKRLIETALYSPEWLELIGEYLEIPSFASACYYFMAHMNERLDDKRRATIARFTPLSEEELSLGAFDTEWFHSAYDALGEKDFDLIYDAAKYIADGAKHARARKYADAALGRFTVDETEALISDKRNKDLLMAYPLIPLTGEDDLLRRYAFIQKFRKESKKFGAQRIASEGKASEMALRNLATRAGYADTMRLTLRMETKMFEDNRELMGEHIIDDITLTFTIDENGKADILVAKNGKALKSIPAKLKKHETVLALTALKKTFTEQYRRAKKMFEEAMEDGTVFSMGEIRSLSAHPVVFPMLSKLVLMSGDTFGFPSADGLINERNEAVILPDDAPVSIAHPYHLYQNGVWQTYQRILFEKKIVQPFRQVFRELYVKTAEEAETMRSFRYAGNQINPAKTVSALKTRRWVADIENGLQKIYYKENLVAELYALADWFSPADIEAPTLEFVAFADRKTGAPVKLADVPDVIFSEVMRDVDLAVSIAHAGGVDPETSHSTVEMRASLLSFILPMFGIENVRIEKHHAFIEGSLAEYSVHLGSGTVHQIGGTMIPVLPVHSQHRGKIFLPFADEDPKTAEITSKILLFAEDTKIKDPSILACIKRR